jgi:hypothetical protein
MAAADAGNAFEPTTHSAVLANGLDEVVAARRIKSAMPTQQRPENQLITINHLDENPAGQTYGPFDQESNDAHDGESGADFLGRSGFCFAGFACFARGG